jgi:ABC-type nitrate/sulfonate/bicarbonate transport system substrate-binding protein
MRSYTPTRRNVLQAVVHSGIAFFTLSASMKTLGSSASAQTAQKIMMGTSPVTALIGSYIGQVDFFKEEGLDIEWTRFVTGPPMMQAMAAGNIVVGDTGLANTIVAIARGLPLQALYLGACSTPTHPFERFMVMETSPIRTLDDLKDKKLAFLGAGSVPDMLLGALSRKTKIRKEDVQLVPMPGPNMPDALAQGLVDAIFAVPPNDTLAEQRYKVRTIADASELVPYSGLTTLAVKRDFAEAHPEAVKKIVRACIRSGRWIEDNPAEARRAVTKNLGLPENLAAEMRIPLFSRNGLPVMPNVWHVYEMLVRAKTIDPHPDPAKLFNDAIVEPVKRFTLPAVEELGLQPDPELDKMLTADYPLLPKPAASYYADWERRLLKT